MNGTKNKRCRRFLQWSFTRDRFACIRFSPVSHCTTSGRLTYLHTATALPFVNFLAGRVRTQPILRSIDFRQWPEHFSVFGFFLDAFFDLMSSRRMPRQPPLEIA
jgi:hypothetical protein